jgi:TIR domain
MPHVFLSYVFLSYARSDAPLVDTIARDLAHQGVSFWMDRQDLVPGEEWLPQINRAMSKADFMIVFLSKASLKSKAVRHGCGLARPRNLVGESPTQVTASHGLGIKPCSWAGIAVPTRLLCSFRVS